MNELKFKVFAWWKNWIKKNASKDSHSPKPTKRSWREFVSNLMQKIKKKSPSGKFKSEKSPEPESMCIVMEMFHESMYQKMTLFFTKVNHKSSESSLVRRKWQASHHIIVFCVQSWLQKQTLKSWWKQSADFLIGSESYHKGMSSTRSKSFWSGLAPETKLGKEVNSLADVLIDSEWFKRMGAKIKS